MPDYGDLEGAIWFDGEMIPWRDAKVHFLTHSLHYGSAVFEGERWLGSFEQLGAIAKWSVRRFHAAARSGRSK